MQRISGASGRFTIRTFRPFGSTRSTTWLESVTSCPRGGRDGHPADRQERPG